MTVGKSEVYPFGRGSVELIARCVVSHPVEAYAVLDTACENFES